MGTNAKADALVVADDSDSGCHCWNVFGFLVVGALISCTRLDHHQSPAGGFADQPGAPRRQDRPALRRARDGPINYSDAD
jgi:hypothetical protein